VQDISALGAARIAAQALGWDSFAGREGGWTLAGTTVNPVEADRELYRERLAIFRDAATATLPIMHRLHQQP
jgi:sugar (pentulose or hexulose) kinase